MFLTTYFGRSCHTNCAENCPEVEVFEGKWKDVFSAVNRSKNSTCVLCDTTGATIGCSHRSCDRCYHFGCGEDTGWRFDVDGKEYFCELHRNIERDGSNRISMHFLQSHYEGKCEIVCALCNLVGNENEFGELLAFKRFTEASSAKRDVCVVHEYCIKHTNIVDVKEDQTSRTEKEFQNVFTAIDQGRSCSACSKPGATIFCTHAACERTYHFPCARRHWKDFDKKGAQFLCEDHRSAKTTDRKLAQKRENATVKSEILDATTVCDESSEIIPENVTANTEAEPGLTVTYPIEVSDDDVSNGNLQKLLVVDDEEELDEDEHVDIAVLPAYVPLAQIGLNPKLDGIRYGSVRLARLSRAATGSPWNLELYAINIEGSSQRWLSVAAPAKDSFPDLQAGDVISAINGVSIGSKQLSTLEKVFKFLNHQVEIFVEFRRMQTSANLWQ
jgi:PHD-like zinc-binding domain